MDKNLDRDYQNRLVRLTCEGDVKAFQEIVEIYKRKVYSIARDMCGDNQEAEDISQEVFIKVYRFIGKFRFDSKLSTWIYQISVNTSLDYIRKRKRDQVPYGNSEMENMVDNQVFKDKGSCDPEGLAIKEILNNRIRNLLKELSKREHAAFVMKYYNGLKCTEIAEVLGVSVNTIKTVLLRGKRKLRKKLDQDCFKGGKFYEGL